MSAPNGTTVRRVLIVEDSLRDWRGHYGNFVQSLAEMFASAGATVEVWAHHSLERTVLPASVDVRGVFARSWLEVVFQPSRRGRLFDCVAHNLHLLWALVRGEGINGAGELTFAASANSYHLLAWRMWLALTPRRSRLVLMCFREPWLFSHRDDGDLEWRRHARLYRWLLRSFRGPVRMGRCRLITESEHDARLLHQLAGVAFVVAPVPRPAALVKELAQTRAPRFARRLRFGFLGRPSPEKGFEVLLDLLASDRARSGSAAVVCWVVQWHEMEGVPPAWRERLFELARGAPAEFEIVDGALTVERYAELVVSLDALLVPYHRASYVGRGSSVAVDAFCAGLPIVCTAGTWMEEQMHRWGAGVTFRDRNAAALGAAVDELAANHEAFLGAAGRRAVTARTAFSVERFFAAAVPDGLQ